MDYIDLHCHSNASDGSLSPTELVKLAHSLGLQAVALTDHDTLGGLQEAMLASRTIDIELIPGVEISAEFPHGTMHILGYFVWDGRDSLSTSLDRLQKARAERNPRMVDSLNELGFTISLEDVAKFSGGGQIGRPHMAQALLEKGYVSSFHEAFDRYLAKGKPAYVEKFRFSPADAVTMIRKAGAVPGLAHPFTLDLEPPDLESVVFDLKGSGLEAIEVYSPEHTNEQVEIYQKIARQFDLAVTGGTDFHGAINPEIHLGSGRGNFRVPYTLLQELKKRHERLKSGTDLYPD